MRLIRTIALTALGTAALAAMASGSQATSMIPGGPLLRLSESQMSDTREMGCTCTFNRGRAAYVQMIGNADATVTVKRTTLFHFTRVRAAIVKNTKM